MQHRQRGRQTKRERESKCFMVIVPVNCFLLLQDGFTFGVVHSDMLDGMGCVFAQTDSTFTVRGSRKGGQ